MESPTAGSMCRWRYWWPPWRLWLLSCPRHVCCGSIHQSHCGTSDRNQTLRAGIFYNVVTFAGFRRRTWLPALLAVTALCALAESFPPSDVQIVGDLDYGKRSDPVDYSNQPRFRAFVFDGNGGDRV